MGRRKKNQVGQGTRDFWSKIRKFQCTAVRYKNNFCKPVGGVICMVGFYHRNLIITVIGQGISSLGVGSFMVAYKIIDIWFETQDRIVAGEFISSYVIGLLISSILCCIITNLTYLYNIIYCSSILSFLLVSSILDFNGGIFGTVDSI